MSKIIQVLLTLIIPNLHKIIEFIVNIIFYIRRKKIEQDKKVETGKEKQISKELTFFDHIKNIYREHGALFEEINIFGIRDTTDIERDVFNDYICIAYNDRVYTFKATTDPSVYWTKAGGFAKDKKGVAHLCLGYYENAYKVGMHYNYEALVQTGNIVKIWRDGNNNFEKDNSDIIVSGYFGINIHRASDKILEQKIGKHSAGCQVIQSIDEFKAFMSLIKSSDKYIKNTNAKFSYLLISMNDKLKSFIESNI